MELLEREPFLDRLTAQLSAARRGRGSIVLIVGEAGIGKSTLVGAFCDQARPIARVLWGTCDPLVPARPFGPIIDIAGHAPGDLASALERGDRDEVIEAFLAALRRRDGASIVVIDDLHWADQATLDLLRVVGRRVARMPVLVIGTYRDDEAAATHPVRIALGDIPRDVKAEIRLPPLSVEAVARLAGPRRLQAPVIHAVTSGNPFFITEVLAEEWREDGVPASVRDAVLARVERRSTPARGVLQAAAVLGPGCDADTVVAVADESDESLDDCLQAGLLEERDGSVWFRHELARRAVLGGIPAPRRTELHRRALTALARSSVLDPARMARHAIGAEDGPAILEYAAAAARQAASLGSHREAAAFFQAELGVVEGLDDQARAEDLEAFAREASLADDVPSALAAQREAVRLWQEIDDVIRVACAMVDLSGYLWLAGSSDEAMSTALVAADRLEAAAPGSPQLARALSVAAQRLVVAGSEAPDGTQQARRAMAIAEQRGDERTAIHALTTLSIAQMYSGDPAGWVGLETAVSRAAAADLPDEGARAWINLVEGARDLRRLELADRYLRGATAFLDAHEMDLYSHLLRCRVAGLELDAGRWDSAVRHAEELLGSETVSSPARVRALTVLGLVQARQGGADRWWFLDQALLIEGSEIQDLGPLRAARSETAWLDDDLPLAREEAARGLALGGHDISPWMWSELAFWGCLAGAEGPLPNASESPYWLQVTGHPREAATAWSAIGAPYQAAFALAASDIETDLREALRTFNELGSAPMAGRVTRKLRHAGAMAIARGPRPLTRRNPAGLTERQLEVVALLAGGRTNREIAAHLVVSPKTVDHHVSAILRKLGVSTRADAADTFMRLSLPDGDRKMGGPHPQDGGSRARSDR